MHTTDTVGTCVLTKGRLNLLFCLYSWATGEWETCSASCGQTGWQRRWVSCQQTSSSGQQQERSVPSKLCGENRPVGKQTCNRFPCPASWRRGPWTRVWPANEMTRYWFAFFKKIGIDFHHVHQVISTTKSLKVPLTLEFLSLLVCIVEWLHSQCSVSCGNGTQERQVVCSSPGTSFHNCSEPRPITKRTCQAPPCNGRYQLTSLSFCGGTGSYWILTSVSSCRRPQKFHRSMAVQVQHKLLCSKDFLQ